MNTPLIFNIQRFSIHDGGGIRTIVFFKGCPLHCPWCSNPEGISTKPQLIRNNNRCIQCSAEDAYHCTNTPDNCPVNALTCCGQEYTVDQLVKEIASDQIIYDEDNGGVTFSGGEPFLFPEFLEQLLSRIRPWTNSIAVETCGNVPFENIEKALPYVDLYLYDLKIMDEEKFRDVCGGNLSIVISNLENLVSLHKNVIPRIPLIPTFTDDVENIDRIAQLSLKLGLKQVHLLPFHQMGSGKYENMGMPYTLSELRPFTDDQISAVVSRLESGGLQVITGGF
ncbi:glycyl-radical enzyme activating protein [Pelolinea submarina]|uniref:Pyruvate formate lyase activating enzyme n=1 Tax=Pelolinea submarina TaxID=913107 RepID=A0A347ZNX5_9CHLR|nr:glycyl-radical enzyme activating protein [Pelolinea submarina]REG08609.1 pyruvate formate lyase activating enzyme [Pelolinea submarina]BBB47006.1 pyruvate formate lyase activating enzyme [Pelolinea submarina]